MIPQQVHEHVKRLLVAKPRPKFRVAIRVGKVVFQFATCVELVRALGGTLSHEQITENVEVVSLILPFNKFKEV